MFSIHVVQQGLSTEKEIQSGKFSAMISKTKEAAESKPIFDHEGAIFSTPTLTSFTKLKIRRSF